MSATTRTRRALGAAVVAAAAAAIVPASASAGFFTQSSCQVAQQPGMLNAYGTLSQLSDPTATVLGPDGNIWFTENASNAIGRITPTGTITEFPLPQAYSSPTDITVGPDGNLWFTMGNVGKIGTITTAGAITQHDLPWSTSTSPVRAIAITTGPDGALWFTQSTPNIGRITTAGVASQYAIGIGSADGVDIASGPGGMLWASLSGTNGYGLVSITTSGTVTPIQTPTNSQPGNVTQGPDGNLWYTDYKLNSITRVVNASPKPVFTAFPKAVSNSAAAGWATIGSKMWFMDLGGQVGTITTAGVINEYPYSNSRAFGLTSQTVNSLSVGSDGNLWFAEGACDAVATGKAAAKYGMWTTSRPSTVKRGKTYTLKVKSSAKGTAKIAIANATKRTTVLNASVKKGTTTIKFTVPASLSTSLVGKSALMVNGIIKGLVQSGQSSPLTVKK